MVTVAVAENDPEERRITLGEAWNFRQKILAIRGSVKRQATIERDPDTFVLQFEAGSADLPGSPVYPRPHCLNSPTKRPRTIAVET